MNTRALLVGVGVGAGLTYFLDPARGARRRAHVRDTVTHSARVTRRAVGTVSRDMRQRTYGTAASVRAPLRKELVGDQVVVERVRAKLGRLVSHLHAIEVTSTDCVVRLRGPILEREANSLFRAVRRVPGVDDVIDELDRHEKAGNIPALQGGRPPVGERFDAFRPHWAPTTRVVLGTVGAAMAGAGPCSRTGKWRGPRERQWSSTLRSPVPCRIR